MRKEREKRADSEWVLFGAERKANDMRKEREKRADSEWALFGADKEANMTVYEGRPKDNQGRLERETKVYDLLDQLNIPYWRTDHERADTMTACNEIDRVLDVLICKNLFLCNRQKTKFYLLMMPGDKPFRTKELSAQIQSARLSFAPEEYMEEYLHIAPGAVSIMGLMNDTENHVQLLVDEDVLKGEFLGCHPCVCTSSLKLYTKDVFETFLKEVHHDYIVVSLTGE